MHSGRIVHLIVAIAMLPAVVMLAGLAWRDPHPLVVGITVAFLVMDVVLFYRVFIKTDAWYVEAEARERRINDKLFEKYPILMTCLAIFGVVSMLSQLVQVLG